MADGHQGSQEGTERWNQQAAACDRASKSRPDTGVHAAEQTIQQVTAWLRQGQATAAETAPGAAAVLGLHPCQERNEADRKVSRCACGCEGGATLQPGQKSDSPPYGTKGRKLLRCGRPTSGFSDWGQMMHHWPTERLPQVCTPGGPAEAAQQPGQKPAAGVEQTLVEEESERDVAHSTTGSSNWM